MFKYVNVQVKVGVVNNMPSNLLSIMLIYILETSSYELLILRMKVIQLPLHFNSKLKTLNDNSIK